jgi:hypothetical protein
MELDDQDYKLGSYDIRFENGTVYRMTLLEAAVFVNFIVLCPPKWVLRSTQESSRPIS